MSNKKENILKRLGEYLDTIFTIEGPLLPAIEAPIVEAAAGDPPVVIVPEVSETPKIEELPDGEYTIKVKGGVIESCEPMEAPVEETEEELAKKKKAKCDEEELAKEALKTQLSSDLTKDLTKEFETKLAAQKAEFELKLKELTDAKSASGIVQAPVEKLEPKIYSAKEIIMKNAEEKRGK